MTEYILLEENSGLSERSQCSSIAKAVLFIVAVTAGFSCLSIDYYPAGPNLYERGNEDRSASMVESWESLAVGECTEFHDATTCDEVDECVWCESGAVPSRCYPKNLAKRLPQGVFQCHKSAESLFELTLNSYESDNTELLCDSTVNQAAGYFRLGDQDKNYFFWFFESRHDPSNDPVVLWMTGGPGCSSELALFVENGPCSVNEDGRGTSKNDFSWNERANLIYIDQPAGTGFSYGTYDTNEVQVGNDMNVFIREFLGTFPQFKENEFFIIGESYAGHYVPATAYAIFQHNKDEDFKINLKGIGIGNGLTDPQIQYQYYADMAYQPGTAPARVSFYQYEEMKDFTPQCIRLIEKCNHLKTEKACLLAVNECNQGLLQPYTLSGYNQYDMRKPCVVPGLCYDFSAVTKYLHRKEVLDYLGVVPEKRDWQSCDMGAHDAMMADWMRNYQDWVATLLENDVRVLVYAGDVDFIVNYLGCRAWPLALEWSGQEGYVNADETSWVVGDDKAGLLRKFKNLSFLQVYQAGHMVPMDKPREALEMLNSFIYNEGL